MPEGSQVPSRQEIRCPICRKRPAADQYFPFCSDRCRTIDLGRWLDGAYQIPVKPTPGEDDEPGEPGTLFKQGR